MEDELGERCEQLVRQVLAPLLLGGPVRPVRPLGAPLGARLGIAGEIVDAGLRAEIEVARVRRARLFAPVDTLPSLDEAEWAMLAALNDLLQLTNHSLGGPFFRGRYARLLAGVLRACEGIAAPREIGAALCRHATFARVFELVRNDTTVSWWTGTATFRGEPPPRRLVRWKQLRRVQIEEGKVELAEMASGVTGLSAREFHDALGLFLTRSPLTDLATATRSAPTFGWSASTLALIAVLPGRSLAFRALSRQPLGAVAAALDRAARAIPPAFEEARALAERFTAEVCAGREAFGEASAGG